MTTDCHVQLFEESIRSDFLLTVKIKITEKVIKDHKQRSHQPSLVKTDLDQKSKMTKSGLESKMI